LQIKTIASRRDASPAFPDASISGESQASIRKGSRRWHPFGMQCGFSEAHPGVSLVPRATPDKHNKLLPSLKPNSLFISIADLRPDSFKGQAAGFRRVVPDVVTRPRHFKNNVSAIRRLRVRLRHSANIPAPARSVTAFAQRLIAAPSGAERRTGRSLPRSENYSVGLRQYFVEALLPITTLLNETVKIARSSPTASVTFLANSHKQLCIS
jgi:hypothetical protein